MKVLDKGHQYELKNVGGSTGVQVLQFIRKDMKDGKLETTIEGTSTEEVLQVLVNRLESLQENLPDPFTRAARYFLGQALRSLEERTLDRKSRKVEGTMQA